ncbi:MAG: NAD(P)H-binding protein [Acidobacteriota bacterium]|nr:MAG: NAD(P)H-binding protein [Acidobacteriota bacterium]
MSRAVVTDAISNIGAAAARALVSNGFRIHILTNRAPSNETSHCFTALRFDPQHLADQMAGADVFIDAYWVRLAYAGQTFASAVANNRLLIDAARKAGVRRYVHVSVNNPDGAPNLGYNRGKAEVEEYLTASSLSYGIVRSTLVVGPNDVLTNNIAWFVRRFPLFPMPRGRHRHLRPVTLDDTGTMIGKLARQTDHRIIDATGPDVMTVLGLSLRPANSTRGIDWVDEGKSVKVRVARVDSVDTVLAHQDGGMSIVNDVAR